MPYRAEGRLNRIRRPNASPVFGREVIECQQLLPVFHKALCCPRVLVFIRLQEQIKGLIRVFLCLRLPDIMQMPLGLGLGGLGQVVEYVHRFCAPSSAADGFPRKPLQQRAKTPSAPSPTASFGASLHPTLPQIHQDLFPALLRFPRPVFNSQEVLLPRIRSPPMTTMTHNRGLSPRMLLYMPSTHIYDPATLAQIPPPPGIVLLGPLTFEPRHGALRKPPGLRPDQRL